MSEGEGRGAGIAGYADGAAEEIQDHQTGLAPLPVIMACCIFRASTY